jgi:hypothetical protein
MWATKVGGQLRLRCPGIVALLPHSAVASTIVPSEEEHDQSQQILRYKNRIRKSVPPRRTGPLKLSNRQPELILKHTFADHELTAPLHVAPVPNKASVYSFTLDDLKELLGYVAAAAIHTKDKNVQKELALLFERIEEVQNSYTDDGDGPTA